MSSVRDWLDGLGLAQYADTFEREELTPANLPEVTADELKDLGLPLGPRKTILKAIAELNDATTGATAVEATVPRLATGTAERRHLTVMFCDLVGSTELSQKLDPETLRELMRAYQQSCGAVMDKYDGHVAQYLGDGLMTYFGWPRAHEDDAERAIRAALEIVEAVKKVPAPDALHVRVGIATGPVVVGETGSGDASVPKLAVGETPNVAARIQGLAQADQILIAPDTRRLVGGTFDLTDFGEHVLKGIVEPVRTWCVTGLAASEGRFDAAHGEALTPLVGRDLELGLLMDRWARAQDGEGQVVLLSGEPGIGKSRILSALRDKLEGEGAQPLRFQCSPYYINSAFWPSIDNFERALKFERDESLESKLDKLEALVVEHFGRPISDVRFVAAMLSIPCDERYGEVAMTPQRFKDETLRTLVDLTEAAARKQPSVMLYEDLHWADPTTLEVADLLIDRVKTMPLLIVLTHRPEFQNRWVDHGHVISLNLSKLTRAQSSELVERVAKGKALPPDLLEQIIAKTDGVPLFVEELTKSILESGELTDVGDHFEYEGKSRSVTIPATLRDSLMARLDRYAPVKEIAQIGAAIGREFSYELVSAVASLSKTQLDDALAQLTESGLAFRRGTPPEATYTFKHALVQDAAYDSLLKRRRQELHARIAKVIDERFPHIKDTEPEVLARHLTAAGLAEAAIPLWQSAGELATKRMALAEAISHLNDGLDCVGILSESRQRDTSELDLRVLLGTAWMAHKGWAAPEVWDSFYPALTLAKFLKRNDAILPILSGLAQNVMCQGHVAESMPWIDEMFEVAEATEDADLLITAHARACNTYFFLGKPSESLEHGSRALSLYQSDRYHHHADILNHDPKSLVSAFSAICKWALGYPDQALKMSDEGVMNARRRRHPFDLGFAMSMYSDLLIFRGDFEMSLKINEEIERVGRENSLPILWGFQAPGGRGKVLLKRGKAAEGVGYLRSALALWDSAGAKVYSPYAKTILAEGMAILGELDNSLQLIQAQIDQVERIGWEERYYYSESLRIKAWILMLKDDADGAEKAYLLSLDSAREQKAKSWELRTSTSLARLWQTQGKQKEALDLLKPVYNWFTEGFDTKDLIEAKALLDELAT